MRSLRFPAVENPQANLLSLNRTVMIPRHAFTTLPVPNEISKTGESMTTKSFLIEWRRALVGLSLFALLSNNFYAFGVTPKSAAAASADRASHT